MREIPRIVRPSTPSAPPPPAPAPGTPPASRPIVRPPAATTAAPVVTQSQATRYMCAAAHHDSGFREKLIGRLRERHHAIGHCFGVDLEAVCRYAVAGHRRHLYRDLILTLLAAGLILSAAIPGARILLLLCIVAAYVTVLWEQIATHTIAAQQLTRGRYRPDGLDVALDDADRQLMAEARSANVGNVIVYSGYSPFVGSGVELGNWSFVVDVTRPKTALGSSHQPVAFELEELYQHTAQRIAALQMDNVEIEDRLYVNGTEIKEDRRFLPDAMRRPATGVSADVMREFANTPTEAIRHYKCITVTYWQGELVFSVFLRFVRISKSLFAECSYYMLPPLKPEYHRIDSLTPTTAWTRYARMMIEAGFLAPFAWLAAPFTIFNRSTASLLRGWTDAATRRRINQDNAFDFGCRRSLREEVQADRYRQYFQVLDRSMYQKLLERQLLDAIVAFLDARNVDTSDLAERQNAILNSGVIVMGGVAAGGDLTLGQNIVNRISRTVRRLGEGGSAEQPQGQH